MVKWLTTAIFSGVLAVGMLGCDKPAEPKKGDKKVEAAKCDKCTDEQKCEKCAAAAPKTEEPKKEEPKKEDK